ncbi:aromatic acid exporter family protein [Evansella sp. AB-rgal1]|uniref:FUSC family protein n=1 Tax=Evansella sp. AB-rgal1 TaxID=3242696 RepID=UPI00359F121C
MRTFYYRYIYNNSWIGQRIIKTGIAVFITAAICLRYDLPAVFAVITAIVTLEPTASDSIKKGVVRFPASAIGAGFAVLFVSLFGNSPVTFMLAAILTITLCQKLKLHHGTLVATLTAVAMIPDIHDHFFLAFITRLGTTTIGLTVSTLVNLLILPPRYVPFITNQIKNHYEDIQQVFSETIEHLKNNETTSKQREIPFSSYISLRRSIEKTQEMTNYQELEWKYHRINHGEFRLLKSLKRQLNILQKMSLHLGNLQYIDKDIDFTDYEMVLLDRASYFIRSSLKNLQEEMSDDHYYVIYELDQYLKYDYSSGHRKDPEFFHHFHAKTVVFYEVLSFHDCLEELQHHLNRPDS